MGWDEFGLIVACCRLIPVSQPLMTKILLTHARTRIKSSANKPVAVWLRASAAGRVAICLLLSALHLPATSAEFTTLAFGSCNHGHLPQPLWPIIETHQPDLFLWTGDVVYADTTNPQKMRQKYQQQLDRPGYQRFTSRIPVDGIWDDHDFGINNGGRNNPVKKEAQRFFLDFMGEAADSPRRSQEGIYTSFTKGEGNRTVKFFLLDTRYHRGSTGSGRGDNLGAAQWHWLEREMQQSTASVNIFVSGVSVMSPQMPFAEEWNDFRWSRKKLFKLIRQYDLPGVLFLSGDRHFSSHLEGRVKGQTYHEFMSSGLTHYMNRKWVSRIFRFVYGDENSFFNRNFSKLTFDWSSQPVKLSFEVFDVENKQQVDKSLWLVDGQWVASNY